MLHAGAAKTDITPPVGTELAGFGYYLNRLSTGVNDRLHSRALYLSDGSAQFVLIASDLIGVDSELVEPTRRFAAEALGPCGVMLAATHTHSGPATCVLHGCGFRDPLYCQHLPYEWARLAARAKAAAKPAQFSAAARTIQPVGQDRHMPEGPTDGLLRLASFDTSAQRILLANHAAHPVVFGSRNTLISADWPGRFCSMVEEKASGAVCLFVNGPCGAINPFSACLSGTEAQDEVERIADRLSGEALAAAEETDAAADGPLLIRSDTVQLPCEPRTRERLVQDAAAYRRALEDETLTEGLQRQARMRFGVCRGLLDAPRLPAQYPAEVQSLSIGGWSMTSVPGELFMHLGKRIYDGAAHPAAMLACYANEWLGYFPHAAAWDEPLYAYACLEAPWLRGWLPYERGAGEKLTETCLKQMPTV
jgi:hypothetical protein